MLAQLLCSVFFNISPIGGRFPIFQQQPQITGFLVLDSILSNNFIALKDTLYHLALPSITLGFLLSGIFSRSLRVNLDKTLKSDYVNAAICRGISRKKIFLNHALPNALLPIVTISGLTMASLAGGALLFEVTFSWPGIALRLHEAISQRDYTLVQGIVIFTSMLIVSLNLFVDILIAYLDPRIEYKFCEISFIVSRSKRWKSSPKSLWFLTTLGIFWSLIFFKNSTINLVDKSCTNIGSEPIKDLLILKRSLFSS
jgi:peptide/nickel transport system permease protein